MGNNIFAYCQNKPTGHKDTTGAALETVWDIISLGASIAEVAVNPADPWAWIGLIGDIADVAIPCVGGLGEAIRTLKAVNAIDNSVDIAKVTENTLKVIADVAHATSMAGESFVYTSYQTTSPGVLEYVGITNDFSRREKEWKNTRKINEYVSGVDRTTARCVEQTVITLFGRGTSDGLSNIRNSIGRKGRLIDDYISFMSKFL